MNNPWTELPKTPPYILPQDRGSTSWQIGAFNEKSIPEPFIGNPTTASLILLNLNPSDDPQDPATHREPRFRAALMGNLIHEATDYPFYPLNPTFGATPCGTWWQRKLRELFDVAKLDRAQVARRLCVIEWFPYHAKDSGVVPREAACPSQTYSFELVRQALENKKLLLGMRAKPRWSKVDQRLAEIPYLKSCQNTAVSVGNTTPELWEMIVNSLR
jgi:hypothetical protein